MRRSFFRLMPMMSDRFNFVTCDQRKCSKTTNPKKATGLPLPASDTSDLHKSLDAPMPFGTSFGARMRPPSYPRAT